MRCEIVDVLADGRIVSPSAERNKGPIAELLMRVLPEQGDVLEVGSGTGQHVQHFAQAMPHIRWQPTERDADCRKSIASWLALPLLPNVNAPIHLDVHDKIWPVGQVAAVVCLNMIHIAPPSATEALLHGAGRVISSGGILFLYGPYRRQGRHTSTSNEAFDDLLRAENPEWGVRNLEDVALLAASEGFELQEVHDMPANNLAIVFSKRRGARSC
jgi:SAM-dependent methyltransferase